MKRIVSVLLIAGIACISSAALAQGKVRTSENRTETAEPKKKKTRDTKYICTIGLEGEGSFTEVYSDKEECRKLCKGGATVCEETGRKNIIDIDDVD